MKLKKIKKHSSSKANEANKLMKLKARGGFTLIEALVAITILTVSIVGPITIASKSISSAMFARDQITAFYLAQEAVEFIRNKRDENNLKGFGINNWLKDLQTCSGATPCKIDVTDDTISNCSGANCPILRYDSNSGFYNYSPYSSTNKDSIFTRNVEMTEIVADNEELITVTMSWRTGIMQKTFVVKEHIFNW